MRKVLSILGLTAACCVAGVSLGILYVRVFIPKPAMGWDGIADMLGGMMAGALFGIIAGAILHRLLPQGKRIKAGLLALGVALLTFTGLISTAPSRPPAPPPAINQAINQASNQAFQPNFG